MPVSKSEVLHLNTTLSNLTPPEILEWSTLNLGLVFQTTSFGPSGMVILDMFSRLKPTISVPLIFIDTLYHFPETLELSEVARKRYDVHVHVYRPLGVDSPAGFEAKHGEEAWKVKDSVYDYHAKVEPSMRAFCELGVECVVTGRRASQGDARDELPVLEVDEGRGVWKVPTNPLHAQGYRSIGDWHSTVPVSATDDERSGRWQGEAKTECGLHKDYFLVKRLAAQQ